MNWKLEGKVIVQGITEGLAGYYAAIMKAYGTDIVAGISAGEGGTSLQEIPVFDLVEEAVAEMGEIATSLIYVSPYQVLDAALEAIASGIRQLIIIAPGVPPLDMVRLNQKAQATQTLILGPGSAGILIPEKICLGTQIPELYHPGSIGIVSRTATIAAEVALALHSANLGVSLAVSIGTDSMLGSNFEQWLQILAADTNTQAIVMIGKISGSAEKAAAEYLAREEMKKPLIAYLTGKGAPIERTFADAATVIANQLSSAVSIEQPYKQVTTNLEKAQIPLVSRPAQIPALIKPMVT